MFDLPRFMLQQAQCGAGARKKKQEVQSWEMLTEETFICSSPDVNYKKGFPPTVGFVVDFLLM